MRRMINRGELCFAVVDVVVNQQFMHALIVSTLIFLVGWVTFALGNTTLANAQTNSKSNITTPIGRESNSGGNPSNIIISDGIASGDATDHSAIIWSKSSKNSLMNVWYDTNSKMTNPKLSPRHPIVNQSNDFTGHVKLENLRSDSVYYYQVQFSDPKNTSIASQRSAIGLFHTAPESNGNSNRSITNKSAISFVVGGDLGGQNYCKRAELSGGYPIFAVIRALSPDFF